MRIAIAGFQHETNTFGATQATFDDFVMADSWPGLLRGPQVIPGTAGSNLPLAGFVRAAQADPQVSLIPILWCAAEPASYVTDAAFQQILGEILDGLRAAGPLDGVYLDLHGAMVTESHQDGEGEILRRVRQVVGRDLPVVISLDLHANVTMGMVRRASAMTIFRTYPHLDMAQTGARAYWALHHLVRGGRLYAGFRQVPFLVPLHAQYTGSAPCDALYEAVSAIGDGPETWAEFAMGFPSADIADAGPAVVCYAPDPAAADAGAARLLAAVEGAELRFDAALLSPEKAVAAALAHCDDRPVVIADVQDNAGGGAASDTTGLLAALVARDADAVLGMLNDPDVAAMAHKAGIGAVLETSLGGKAGQDGVPFKGRFAVEALSNGQFAFAGEMYAGSVAETGPGALLRVKGTDVRIVVGSVRCQALDRAVFTQLGVDLAKPRIIAVKSTVHFRADFEPLASRIVAAEAPGLLAGRLDRVPYRNLRAGVRLGPGGPVHAGPA